MQSSSAFKTDRTHHFFFSLSHTHTHMLQSHGQLCSLFNPHVLGPLKFNLSNPSTPPPTLPQPPPPPLQLPQQSNGLDKFSVSWSDGELVFVSLNVTKPMFQGELHIHCVGTKLKVLGHHHPQGTGTVFSFDKNVCRKLCSFSVCCLHLQYHISVSCNIIYIICLFLCILGQFMKVLHPYEEATVTA